MTVREAAGRAHTLVQLESITKSKLTRIEAKLLWLDFSLRKRERQVLRWHEASKAFRSEQESVLGISK